MIQLRANWARIKSRPVNTAPGSTSDEGDLLAFVRIIWDYFWPRPKIIPNNSSIGAD
jgi:hypothetical protein